jgi:hypothetical protein
VRGWLVGKYAHVRVRTDKISDVCLAAIVMHTSLSSTFLIYAQARQCISNTIPSRGGRGKMYLGAELPITHLFIRMCV